MIPLPGSQRSSSMDCKRWRSSINDNLRILDHWKMLSEDLEPKGGILSRRWEKRKVLRNNEHKSLVLSKELGYGKAETLGDTEEAVSWRRDNLVW